MELPGESLAHGLGYSTYSHSGSGEWATYIKEGIALDIWIGKQDNLEAKLSYISGFLVVSTPEFTFPNKNFSVFEVKMERVVSAIKREGL